MKAQTLQSNLKSKGASKQIIEFIDYLLLQNHDEHYMKSVIQDVDKFLTNQNETNAKKLLDRNAHQT